MAAKIANPKKRHIQIGMKFYSGCEMENFFDDYQQQTQKQLAKYNTKLSGNTLLKYHSLSMQCVCFGTYISRSKTERRAKPSKKCGCTFIVKIVLSNDDKALEVSSKSCLKHNEECDKKNLLIAANGSTTIKMSTQKEGKKDKEEKDDKDKDEIENKKDDIEKREGEDKEKIDKCQEDTEKKDDQEQEEINTSALDDVNVNNDESDDNDDFNLEKVCRDFYTKTVFSDKSLEINNSKEITFESPSFLDLSLSGTLKNNNTDETLVKMELLAVESSSGKIAEDSTAHDVDSQAKSSKIAEDSTAHDVDLQAKSTTPNFVSSDYCEKEEQESGVDLQLQNCLFTTEVDENFDLNHLKFDEPVLTSSRGRPRGTTTKKVCGAPVVPRLLPFSKKGKVAQAKTLLRNFVKPEEIINVLDYSYQISYEKIKSIKPNELSDAFLDTDVDASILRKYMSPSAFICLLSLLKRKNSKKFTCPYCKEQAKEGVIFCDSCCLWYHYYCVKVTEESVENSKYFFCVTCQKYE